MKINNKLAIVIPIEHGDGEIYAHSTPIEFETFRLYHMVIAKTFARIYGEGLNVAAGARVAAYVLETIAVEMDAWDGDTGVRLGLMEELRRRTNVIVPTDRGWRPLPLGEASRQGFLDEEDVSLVESQIVFFTVASLMHTKSDRKKAQKGMTLYWGAQFTSSNCTDFAATLPTLTAPATSPQAMAGSSVPT